MESQHSSTFMHYYILGKATAEMLNATVTPSNHLQVIVDRLYPFDVTMNVSLLHLNVRTRVTYQIKSYWREMRPSWRWYNLLS